MSKMYGKRRVVLEQKPRLSGNRLVVVCGSNGQGGLYAPLGYWYEGPGDDFYVDLKSPEQWYSAVSKETIANKLVGPFPTKAALREYVMQYWLNQGAVL
jgi:hypothetical protein